MEDRATRPAGFDKGSFAFHVSPAALTLFPETMTGPETNCAVRHATSAPELLAPAGDWECARAAVENGADGIYFGLERFNARMRAHNFTLADLPELMAFLHRRGVKGYVTFNTLVFADEVDQARDFLRAIIAAGVDAAIVQDIGVARLIRELSPDFPIHASTQMTVTSAAGVALMRELGCSRVILSRECTISEIARIHESGQMAAGEGQVPPVVELEAFVHGALCVAYSGQCLTSESLGGRSANRGECAQACRLPYELISDGKPVPLGDRRYLLSPQDLAGLEVLPDLVRAGVVSLKIEGRLKAPEYVASITRVYRRAIDALTRKGESDQGWQPKPGAGQLRLPARETAEPLYEMEMAFSRGLYTGWFRGINNQELVHARFGKKRGVYLGEVRRIQADRVAVRLEAPLKPGDGVVFDAGRPDQKEEGGRVYEVRAAGRGLPNEPGESLLAFGRDDINFSRVHVGDKIWKTDDPELDRRIRQTFAGDKPQFQRPIRIEVHGHCGTPMTILVQDECGNHVQLQSAMPLEPAESQPLTSERLREQLGRLGGTPFRLEHLTNHIEGQAILPLSELNRLRREAIAKLDELRSRPKRWTLRPHEAPTARARAFSSTSLPEPELVVLVRNQEQFDAALECGVNTLYCEFEDPKRYRQAVDVFRARVMRSTVLSSAPRGESAVTQPAIFVAPPRITKMGEDWVLKQVRSCNADGYLLRNYDHLAFFTDSRRIGDFSLNVSNPISADYFIHRHKLERVTASYDLNSVQLEALLKTAPPEWFEITIHQHIPMFHMEHCVFCAFLSKGTDYTNCGRPCDHHQVELRDRVGARHPVKADAGCRNTVFNALAQTGAEFISRFLALGARRFRVEFLNEPGGTVRKTIEMYRRLLRGEIAGEQLWHELKLVNRLGVTRGPMERAEPKLPKWGEIEW